MSWSRIMDKDYVAMWRKCCEQNEQKEIEAIVWQKNK